MCIRDRQSNILDPTDISGLSMSRSLFMSDNLPDRLEARHEGSGYNVFGLKATTNGQRHYTLSDHHVITSDDLVENGMNSFQRVERDVDVRDLDLKYIKHYPTLALDPDVDLEEAAQNLEDVTDADGNIIPGGRKYSPSKTWEPLSTLVTEYREFSRLYDYMRFALLSADSTTDPALAPGIHHVQYLIPDVKITLPNSDVNAAGTFLFQLRDESSESTPIKNVFVSTHAPDIILDPHINDEVNERIHQTAPI